MLVYDKPEGRMDVGAAMPAAQTRLPVTIVTGYLGSGKTTLISEMVRAPDMSGTAVIVNELADIGIDQSVIADAGAGEVVLLSNGCLCCARGTDLANTVRRLVNAGHAGGQTIQRILIETSGAADPASIARQVTFDPSLRNKVRYGGVLCLFDAVFGQGHLERDPVGYRQIALADMLYVTKTDLVLPTVTAELTAWLGRLNAVPVITTAIGDAADFLSGRSRSAGNAGSIGWLGGAAEPPGSPHEAEIGSWSIQASGPIDWPMTEQALRIIYDRHGDHILRTKGIIRTRDDARPLVIHGINRHFHRPLRLRGWEGEPATRLVVIGFPQAGEAAAEIARVLGGVAAGGTQLVQGVSKKGGMNMAKTLENKVALVTGGARGVGREVVRRLARDGADIAFVYGASEAAARETETELQALGVRAKGYHADLDKPEDLPDVAKTVLADFGRIDILVNCAGIFTVGMLSEVTFTDYERAMNVNLDSVYYLTSEVAKAMQSGSRIINISSTLAERAGGAAIAVYNATKSGVSSLARSWAHDLGPRGILVNALQLGHVNTDMNTDTTDYHHEMVKRIPLARYAEPQEIAGVVAFLAGPDAAYITGATINVDGGLNG